MKQTLLILAVLFATVSAAAYLRYSRDEDRKAAYQAQHKNDEAKDAARLKRGAVLVSESTLPNGASVMTTEVPFRDEYLGVSVRTCVIYTPPGKPPAITCPGDESLKDNAISDSDSLHCPDTRYC